MYYIVPAYTECLFNDQWFFMIITTGKYGNKILMTMSMTLYKVKQFALSFVKELPVVHIQFYNTMIWIMGFKLLFTRYSFSVSVIF